MIFISYRFFPSLKLHPWFTGIKYLRGSTFQTYIFTTWFNTVQHSSILLCQPTKHLILATMLPLVLPHKEDQIRCKWFRNQSLLPPLMEPPTGSFLGHNSHSGRVSHVSGPLYTHHPSNMSLSYEALLYVVSSDQSIRMLAWTTLAQLHIQNISLWIKLIRSMQVVCPLPAEKVCRKLLDAAGAAGGSGHSSLAQYLVPGLSAADVQVAQEAPS